MRKFSGVLLAAAMVLSVGMVAASPGGAAAAKPTCKTLSGLATFNPPLPKPKAPQKVKPTITIKGAKLSACTGGGVASGVVSATLKQAIAGNCSTLIAGATANVSGTITIVWNTKTTSTAKVTLKGVPKKITSQTVSGSITTGTFKGSKISVVTTFTPLKGGCGTAGLASVSFKNVSALTIK